MDETRTISLTLDSAAAEEEWLLEACKRAETDGLRANLRRFLQFRGTLPGECIEFQELDVLENGRYMKNYALRTCDIEVAVERCQDAEENDASGIGIFMLLNQIHPGLAARNVLGAWHVMFKGAAGDRDIESRRALMVDIDAKRPSGISATDAERDRALAATRGCYLLLRRIGIPRASLGLGFSGNGGQVYLRLNDLPPDKTVDDLVREITLCLAVLVSAPGIAVDTSVCDRKRLCPAFGTMKRKGVDDAERPHRRTWFVGSRDAAPLTQNDLATLATCLREEMSATQLAELKLLSGDKHVTTHEGKTFGNAELQSPRATRRLNDSPFTVVNAIDVKEVAAWLGLMCDGRAVCPGCGSTGDNSVDFVANGLKCMHSSCASKGRPNRPGFRKNVDLVCEQRCVAPVEAVTLLAGEFAVTLPTVALRNHDAVADGASADVEPRLVSLSQAVTQLEQSWQAGDKFVSTGIRQLDEVLAGGIRPGNLVAVSGQAGVSKSAFVGAGCIRGGKRGRGFLRVDGDDRGGDRRSVHRVGDVQPRHGRRSRMVKLVRASATRQSLSR